MRKSLVAKIILTFFFVGIIPLFLLNLLYLDHNKKISDNYINESLQKLADEKAQIIASELKKAEIELVNLATMYEIIYKIKLEDNVLPAYYKKDARGVIGRGPMPNVNYLSEQELKSVSNIFLPYHVEITPKIQEEIIKTEMLDPVFEDILERNNTIIWAYITTKNNLMRLYPYFDNLIFKADRNPSTYPYYPVIDKNIKDDKAVWINPYYDYGGMGWVISCSKPVFIDGALEAVVSIDIALNTIEKALADFRLGKSGFYFLIDKDSNVIYHPDYIPEESKKGDIINRKLLDTEFSEDYREIIKKMVAKERGLGSYDDNKKIAYAPIEYFNGSIGIEINSNDYSPSIQSFSKDLVILAIILVFLVAIFGLYIFIKISKPVSQLTQDVKRIAAGDFGSKVRVYTNDEIGVLADSFNVMNDRLKSYMEDIIKSKKQLETVFNSIGGLLMIIDINYVVKKVNRQETFLKQYGESPIGEKCYKIIAGFEEPCPDCPVEKTLKSKKEEFSEVIITKEIYHKWSYPIKDRDEGIQEIVMYSNRVTDIILLEQELSQAEKLAGIGQLVAGVMHELKNPIAIIKGASYLLHNNLKKDEKPQVQAAVEEIDNSVARAENIIHGLLDFSKKSILQQERIDICGLIRQILMFEREVIVRKRIDVILDFEETPLWVNSNVDSLKHIFLNIIKNAIDAMKDGGKLTISGKRIKNNKVQIGVKDTGPGINPEHFERVFEPFYTTKGEKDGTGLGLWIVSREVEKNNGSIKINSQIGKGTEFVLIFTGDYIEEELNEYYG